MDLAIPALLDPASVVPQKIRLQTTNDGAIELELKSPSVPFSKGGISPSALNRSLEKRGRGDFLPDELEELCGGFMAHDTRLSHLHWRI